MKRISLLVLALWTAVHATGCCHSYYTRCCDRDDSCHAAHRGRGRHRHSRGDRGNAIDGCDVDGGFCSDGCDCCCDAGSYGQPIAPAQPASYSGAVMGSGCAGGNCAQGAMMNGVPMSGGCASGNCGSMQTYAGTPFDPSAGWTIQSTTSHPASSEPVPAPAISPATPITPAPSSPASPSTGWAPSPGSSAPVPPPVSFNR